MLKLTIQHWTVKSVLSNNLVIHVRLRGLSDQLLWSKVASYGGFTNSPSLCGVRAVVEKIVHPILDLSY